MDDAQNRLTDEDLVLRSLEETWRFGELVSRYEAPLRRYLSRLGRFSSEDLEDLLQNIFMKVYQNLNGFDTSLSFASWIYRIAHNEAISFFRYAKARPQGHMVDVPDETLTELLVEVDMLALKETDEASGAVARALDELSPAHREVLLLKYFEYKSYDEISDILQVPMGTVAARLNRAKSELRAIMNTNGYYHA